MARIPPCILAAFSIFIASCELPKTEPVPLPPDPREEKMRALFREDSLDFALKQEKILHARTALPLPADVKPEKFTGTFTVHPGTQDFPLFTYDYFLYPDSFSLRSPFNEIDLHLQPVTYADQSYVASELGKWEKWMRYGYLYILYPKTYEAPKMGTGKEFTPGKIKGTVVVYSLVQEKVIHSFKIEATNSSFVFISTYSDLDDDLRNSVIDAIRAKI